MAIPVRVLAGLTALRATSIGELVVGTFSREKAKTLRLNVNNIAFNFASPVTGKTFIVKGILLVPTSGIVGTANINIYEASSEISTTIDESIFDVELLKNQIIPLSPLDIEISEGAWLNAKTDDNTVVVTILGYYVPASS